MPFSRNHLLKSRTTQKTSKIASFRFELRRKIASSFKVSRRLQNDFREKTCKTLKQLCHSQESFTGISNYAENLEDRLIQIRASPKDRLVVQLSSSNDGKIVSFCFEELHWGHPWPERQRNNKALLHLQPSFRHHRQSYPAKKSTHTHNIIHSFIHSFIHHRLVLIGLRLLSTRFLLLHLPLLPCALLAQKRAEERRIHIINHFVHATTQNKTSLSLSLSLSLSSSLQSLDPTSWPWHWNSPTLETHRTSSILRQQKARKRSKRQCRRRLRRQESDL